MGFIDITGQKFNHWLVIKREKNNARGDAMWLCECDCENHTQQIVKGSALRTGHSKSCGCIKKQAAQEVGHKNRANLVGKIFGKLTVLEYSHSENYQSIWKCKCECGNIIYVSTNKLNNGHTKSCGCLVKHNLIGQQFGKLTVIEETDKRASDGTIIWKCQCSCQNHTIIEVSTSKLLKGEVKDCMYESGSMSSGEVAIKLLLEENNLPFQREKVFKDFIYEDTQRHPRFDFYVNNSYLIEFDGVQHFRPSSQKGFFPLDVHEKIKERDVIKNQYCLQHNIPIIRIPYTRLKNLVIEDLLLESSPYLIKNKE